MSSIKDIVFHIWRKLISRSKFIFIMAHARSGSSLLEHILSSNPEILGAGEQSRIYKSKKDLIKMNIFTRKSNRKYFKKYKYIVDQVLDNSLTPKIDVLTKDIKFIFLIRNPEESISSLEHIANKYGKEKEFNAFKYYTDRISYLVYLSKLLGKNNQIFITYNELIYDTENTLKYLTDFLGLDTSLTKNYKLKNSTTRFGDPSKNIEEETIIVTDKKLIALDKNTKIESNKVFNNAYKFFKNWSNQ